MPLVRKYLILYEMEHTYLLVAMSWLSFPLPFTVLRFIGFSMRKTTNEQNYQSEGKGDITFVFITVQP